MRLFTNSKASCPNDINEHSSSSSTEQVHHEPSSKSTQRSYISSTEHEWETLDDPLTMTKCRAWETLSNALYIGETEFGFTNLVTIANNFCLRYILHEAISLCVPDHVLIQLADRFPESLHQRDGNGRYPVHVACVFGSSSKFVSYCIDSNPSSAAAKDIEGKTPAHLLCQGTCRDFWDAKCSHAAKKNIEETLWVLYTKAPSSVVSKDNYGVGSIEYALKSDLGIKIIWYLQDMIGHYNKNEAHERTVRKCLAARRQLTRKGSINAGHVTFAESSRWIIYEY